MGEVGGYVCVWVSGEVGLRAVFCWNNFYDGFFPVCLFIKLFNVNAFDVAPSVFTYRFLN